MANSSYLQSFKQYFISLMFFLNIILNILMKLSPNNLMSVYKYRNINDSIVQICAVETQMLYLIIIKKVKIFTFPCSRKFFGKGVMFCILNLHKNVRVFFNSAGVTSDFIGLTTLFTRIYVLSHEFSKDATQMPKCLHTSDLPVNTQKLSPVAMVFPIDFPTYFRFGHAEHLDCLDQTANSFADFFSY